MSATAPDRATVPVLDGFEVIDDIDDLDDLIWSSDHWDWDGSRRRAVLDTHVRRAVALHLACCDAYRQEASRQGVLESDGSLVAGLDLGDVPVYPTGVFKRAAPTSVADERIEQWFTSSGTSGRPSVVPRDRSSLERLLGSLRSGLALVDDLDDDIEVLNLGPPVEDAGQLWFAYVMSMVELAYPTTHVGGIDFPIDDAVRALRRLLDAAPQVAVIGSPALVRDLAVAARADGGVAGGGRVIVVTAGGWKRRSGEVVGRSALRQEVAASLGLDGEDQVRDAFNQVELNSVFVECRRHRLHVPPWVHVTTRRFADLRACPAGEEGVISYLDASATSYPCFIVGEDVGRVDAGPCACGREGPTVEVKRRLRTTDARGCALSLNGAIGPAARR